MGPSERQLKRRLLVIAGALGIAAAACNALVGLDGFEKDDCAHCGDAGDGGDASDGAMPDASTDAPNAMDAPPPIPDGASAVSWAQWPMPSPEAGPTLFSYTVNGDGTVTDKKTALVWRPLDTAAFGPTISGFDKARAFCDSLGDGGTKWRLPTRIELITLIDFSRHDPAVSPAFSTSLTGGWYWTSSVVRPVAIPYRFWSVDFTTGEVSDNGPNVPRTVMCVKQ